MIDKPSAGKRIKELRLQHKLTQDELAEKTNLSRTTITNAEKGSFTIDTLCTLADSFDTSVDYLLGRTETGNKAAEIINNLKRYFNIRFEKETMFVSISNNLMEILKSLDEIEKIQSNSNFISKDTIESMKKDLFAKYGNGFVDGDVKDYIISAYKTIGAATQFYRG